MRPPGRARCVDTLPVLHRSSFPKSGASLRVGVGTVLRAVAVEHGAQEQLGQGGWQLGQGWAEDLEAGLAAWKSPLQ